MYYKALSTPCSLECTGVKWLLLLSSPRLENDYLYGKSLLGSGNEEPFEVSAQTGVELSLYVQMNSQGR